MFLVSGLSREVLTPSSNALLGTGCESAESQQHVCGLTPHPTVSSSLTLGLKVCGYTTLRTPWYCSSVVLLSVALLKYCVVSSLSGYAAFPSDMISIFPFPPLL